MGNESQAAESRATTEIPGAVTPFPWPALLEWLEQNYSCRGVLLYGSAVHGQVQAGSDVDLLGLTLGAPLRSIQTVFAGQELDLLLGREDALAQMMQRDVEGNGNFVLRALVHGRVLLDVGGALATLVERAGRRWAEGPSVAGERERRLIRARCLKISGAARRMEKTPPHDAPHLRLREVQLALFLGMLVKDFCRVHRRWASSMREMSENSEFGELQVALQRYMRSSDAAERISSIRRISQNIAASAKV